MNILYLSNTRFAKTPYRDGSTRYRCYHYAEELLRHRHVADVGVIEDTDPQIIERYDAVVVLRPTLDRRLERILDACRDARVTLVADFDDLIFNPEFASASPIVLNRQATVEQIQSVYQRHLDALQCFDKVTVATQELAWKVKDVAPHAQVLHLANGLSRFWLDYNRHVSKPDTDSCRDIIYMPGTRSHDLDFSEVQSVLAQTVNSSAKLRCKIIGALEVDSNLFDEDKLLRGSWIDYFSLPKAIADSYVSIAPLAQTAFNQCKSHIKFIESAAFGTPVICSNCPDASQHQVDGLSIVNSAEEWTEQLQRYNDPEYYQHCSDALQTYARKHCMAQNSVSKFIELIENSNTTSDHEDIITISKAS